MGVKTNKNCAAKCESESEEPQNKIKEEYS